MNRNIPIGGFGARQGGAALIVGLILLLVLTILAVSGVITSTLELRMVGNTQLQERAFQAAEVAVEDALANSLLSTSTPVNQATIPNPDSPDDQYSFQLQFVGQTPLGTGMTGYSIGTSFTCLSLPGGCHGHGARQRPGPARTELLHHRAGRLLNTGGERHMSNSISNTRISERAVASGLRRAWLLAAALGALASATAFAGPPLGTIEECIESGTDLVRLPGVPGGTLTAKACSACDSQRLTFDAKTRYFIGKKAVAYAKFREAAAKGSQNPIRLLPA